MSATDNRPTGDIEQPDVQVEYQNELTEGEQMAEQGQYAPQERTPQEKASLLFGAVFLLFGAACWLIFL